jgi:hypothetical protein
MTQVPLIFCTKKNKNGAFQSLLYHAYFVMNADV